MSCYWALDKMMTKLRMQLRTEQQYALWRDTCQSSCDDRKAGAINLTDLMMPNDGSEHQDRRLALLI